MYNSISSSSNYVNTYKSNHSPNNINTYNSSKPQTSRYNPAVASIHIISPMENVSAQILNGKPPYLPSRDNSRSSSSISFNDFPPELHT